jgi:amino acid transporter
VASAFAGSVAALFPAVGDGVGRALLLGVLFASLAFVNVRGVRSGAGLVEAVTAAKLLPLLVLVVAGVWFVRWDYLAWPGWPSASQVGRTAIVLIFAFVGVEVALVPSGEVLDPPRTVPRALFLALATTTMIYLLVQGVAQGLLGPQLAEFKAAPLAEAALRVLGPWGRLLVLVGATVSMFGYVSGDMLGSPRALFAFSRDGVFPSALSRVHAKYRTPYIAIVTHAAIVATLAISSSFTQLAILANVAALSLYLMCVAASFELQRREVRAGGTPFAVPGGPVIPILAALAIIWLLSQATWKEFAIEAIVLAFASVFFAVRRPERVHSA